MVCFITQAGGLGTGTVSPQLRVDHNHSYLSMQEAVRRATGRLGNGKLLFTQLWQKRFPSDLQVTFAPSTPKPCPGSLTFLPGKQQRWWWCSHLGSSLQAVCHGDAAALCSISSLKEGQDSFLHVYNLPQEVGPFNNQNSWVSVSISGRAFFI